MRLGERLAVVGVCEQHIVVVDYVQREVGGVAAVAVRHNMGSVGLGGDERHNRAERHALPCVLELAPLSNAVELGVQANLGQVDELVPAERDFVVHQSEHPKAPCVQVDARGGAVCEDGEFGGDELAGGDVFSRGVLPSAVNSA